MVDEILCPECGGVVGATETTEAGAPCTCFRAPAPEEGSDQSDETVSEAIAADHLTPAEQKICRICGKDVTGKKRARDHLGYYCYECAKDLESKERQGRVRCRSCGRLHKPEALTLYEGTKMCRNCHRERLDAKKKSIRQLGFKQARTREEIRQLMGIVALACILLLFMIYGAFHMRHR